MYLAASCLPLINLQSLTCTKYTIFLKSMHDTHVEHCIYLPTERKKKETTINGNTPALQCTLYKKK